MLVAKIELKSGVERWTFGGKLLCLDLRAVDLAKRPSRLDTDMAEASFETKIKISAQFFSHAYLKYNITTDAGLGRSTATASIRAAPYGCDGVPPFLYSV